MFGNGKNLLVALVAVVCLCVLTSCTKKELPWDSPTDPLGTAYEPPTLGKDWLVATETASYGNRRGATVVVFDGKMWLIGGQVSGTYRNDVWSSSDGETWKRATSAAGFSARYYHSSIVHAGQMWVIGGYNGSYLRDVWYSANGANWTQATATAAFSARNRHSNVVYNDGGGDEIWVIGGRDDSFAYRECWASANGANWVNKAAPMGDAWSLVYRYNHASVVFGGYVWTIGGWLSGPVMDRSNDVSLSTDGQVWVPFTPAFSARDEHAAVVHDSKMWVIGGNFNKSDVWYSSDGMFWQQATAEARFADPYPVYTRDVAVSHSGKIWFFPGNTNDVWHSP